MWVLRKSVKSIRTGRFIVTSELKLVLVKTMWRNRLALNVANLLSHSKTWRLTQMDDLVFEMVFTHILLIT